MVARKISVSLPEPVAEAVSVAAERAGLSVSAWLTRAAAHSARTEAGLAAVAGPTLGGIFVDALTWRSVFWINVPLLAVALVASLHLVPQSRDARARRLDPVGATLSAAAIASSTYAVIEAPDIRPRIIAEIERRLQEPAKS